MTMWKFGTLGPGEASRLAKYMRQSRPGMGNSSYPRLFMAGSPSHLAMLVELYRDEQEQGRRAP
jgi:hypothetical protein